MDLRRAGLGLVLLAFLPGASQALQTMAAVADAPPTLVAWDLRVTPCAPPGTVTPAAGPRACIHARDANGHADLCAARALGRSTLTVLLASGHARTLPLSCEAAQGRDAWLAADLAGLAGARLFHLHLEDAWGASLEADLVLDGSLDVIPPQRHSATLPSRRAPDLLP